MSGGWLVAPPVDVVFDGDCAPPPPPAHTQKASHTSTCISAAHAPLSLLLCRLSGDDNFVVQRLPLLLVVVLAGLLLYLTFTVVQYRRSFSRHHLSRTASGGEEEEEGSGGGTSSGLPYPEPFTLSLTSDFPILAHNRIAAGRRRGSKWCGVRLGCRHRRCFCCCGRSGSVVPAMLVSGPAASAAVGVLRGAMELSADGRTVTRKHEPRLSGDGDYAVAVARHPSWQLRRVGQSTQLLRRREQAQLQSVPQANGGDDASSRGLVVGNSGAGAVADGAGWTVSGATSLRLRLRTRSNQVYIGVVTEDFMRCTSDLRSEEEQEKEQDDAARSSLHGDRVLDMTADMYVVHNCFRFRNGRVATLCFLSCFLCTVHGPVALCRCHETNLTHCHWHLHASGMPRATRRLPAGLLRPLVDGRTTAKPAGCVTGRGQVFGVVHGN